MSIRQREKQGKAHFNDKMLDWNRHFYCICSKKLVELPIRLSPVSQER